MTNYLSKFFLIKMFKQDNVPARILLIMSVLWHDVVAIILKPGLCFEIRMVNRAICCIHLSPRLDIWYHGYSINDSTLLSCLIFKLLVNSLKLCGNAISCLYIISTITQWQDRDATLPESNRCFVIKEYLLLLGGGEQRQLFARTLRYNIFLSTLCSFQDQRNATNRSVAILKRPLDENYNNPSS